MEGERSYEMTREIEFDFWKGSSFSGVSQEIQLTCIGPGSQSCDVLENCSESQLLVGSWSGTCTSVGIHFSTFPACTSLGSSAGRAHQG